MSEDPSKGYGVVTVTEVKVCRVRDRWRRIKGQIRVIISLRLSSNSPNSLGDYREWFESILLGNSIR